MSFQFALLDDDMRRRMRDELDDDVQNSRLYLSPRLSVEGRRLFEGLLRLSVEHHHPDWLAAELVDKNCLVGVEERRLANGRTISARVPVTAAQTLAESEFNRLYARGVCLMAIERAVRVRICRAKQVVAPRAESEIAIGTIYDPTSVLFDIRASTGLEAGLGLHLAPNSGLTLELA